MLEMKLAPNARAFAFGNPIRFDRWNRTGQAQCLYELEESKPSTWEFRNLRLHDLKHTFGRRLRAAGVPLDTRKVLLGHTNGDITTHYSAVEINELIAAVEKLCSSSESMPTLTLLRLSKNTKSRKIHAQRKSG